MNKIYKVALNGFITRECGVSIDGISKVIDALDEEVREAAVLLMIGEYVEPVFSPESNVARGALFAGFDPLARSYDQVSYEYQSEKTERQYFDTNVMDFREATKAVKAGTFVGANKEDLGSHFDSVNVPTGEYEIAKRTCSVSKWQDK